ncbi:hypothetical protein LshimejAT787_3500040 [Lyophyllum shimeji]|uniref:Uncharacterized protein n=1 Tax=Lyophyllum shimeji TaxID=47721 RepID=A0A9P3Q1Y4_LYOSH|nr:hypothetical protein LshimejAT787_2200960 [Lyophyllum shimeji]GLB45876.1 hypothetical protein LshimejAT787_3500040 [Lyophyllum shimeji]
MADARNADIRVEAAADDPAPSSVGLQFAASRALPEEGTPAPGEGLQSQLPRYLRARTHDPSPSPACAASRSPSLAQFARTPRWLNHPVLVTVLVVHWSCNGYESDLRAGAEMGILCLHPQLLHCIRGWRRSPAFAALRLRNGMDKAAHSRHAEPSHRP